MDAASRMGANLFDLLQVDWDLKKGKYFAKGRPCFIEVSTSIEWFKRFSETSIGPLLRDIFTHYLWMKLNLDWPSDPREGGIVFKEGIPLHSKDATSSFWETSLTRLDISMLS